MSQTEWVSVVIPVHNDGARASLAAQAILRQPLLKGYSLDLVLVDDGSTDDTPARLEESHDPRVRVLTLPCNVGRSTARNAGVAAARGELVVFMDCDCVPSDGYLIAHIEALTLGAVASTGHVDGDGGGFWSRYQSEASRRRQHQHARGMPYAGSSQNLAVQRSAFNATGGFDTGYQRYGFEDRELLIRLAEHGEVAWVNGAIVSHRDSLTLLRVAAKMAEAGEYSSARFSNRHSVAYRRLGYAGIDARVHPWLTQPGKVLALITPVMAATFDASHAQSWLPYPVAKSIVKATSAAAYLGGTTKVR